MIKKHALIGLLNVILGFLSKAFYREYVYTNSLNDWGIEGFLPSFFYVLGFSQLLLLKPTGYPKIIILMVTLVSILYEIMQYNRSQFLDNGDIVASIIGGTCSLLIIMRFSGR